MNSEMAGPLVRQAWIDGVNENYPGVPKPSYVKPWSEIDSWERDAVKALYDHVRAIILPSLQAEIRIPPEHGGYLVCSVWNVLMFQLLHDPKPSYVKHFPDLEEWQRKTDMKMFAAIEAAVLQELSEYTTAN